MKVMLVDDHPMVLAALRNIIHTLAPDTEVLTASNPDEAFACLAAQPDVALLLLDLMLGPAVDGFALLADLRLQYPGLPVVVISAIERLTDMVRVIDMGAMGFVPKCSATPELFEAVAMVLAGGVFIPPALLNLARAPGENLAEAAAAADALAQALAEQALERQRSGHLARASARAADSTDSTDNTDNTDSLDPAVLLPMAGHDRLGGAGPTLGVASPQAAAALVVSPLAPAVTAITTHAANISPDRLWLLGLGLTPRQCDVLMLLLKGLPNKLIARELSVSVDTVKDHVAAVLRALGVNSRTQAVVAVGRQAQAGMGLQAGWPG